MQAQTWTAEVEAVYQQKVEGYWGPTRRGPQWQRYSIFPRRVDGTQRYRT